MNPNPNDAPARGGFSGLKMAIPLFLLVAVVFGVTFFAQYKPLPPEDETRGTTGTEPPLRFFSSTRQWMPLGVEGASLQNQVYPGFYEPGQTLFPATFWFENRNPKSVTMQLKGVSCTSCSGGRVAPLPPPVARQILEMTAVSILPQGLVSGLPTGMAGPAANLAPDRLSWQQATFKDTPDAVFKIPAAENADGWSPQWGVLELLFAPKALGPGNLTADFATQIDGTGETGAAKFAIFYEGAAPFEVFPGKIELPEKIDLGRVKDGAPPRTFDLIVYSRTRGAGRTGPGDYGDLGAPKVDVRMPTGVLGEPGPFVSVGPPVRVPEAELEAASLTLTRTLARPIRVEGAYTVTVRVAPKVGDALVDIGPLERDIWVSVPGVQETQSVRLTGMVRGGIALDNDRTDVVIPSYSSAAGVQLSFRLITDDKDAVVGVVGQSQTNKDVKLQAEVTKEPPAGDRGYHKLNLSVPPNGPTGSWSGVVVLEVKGPNPQRIRIPVRGQAAN